jgi:hypothetical protein
MTNPYVAKAVADAHRADLLRAAEEARRAAAVSDAPGRRRHIRRLRWHRS